MDEIFDYLKNARTNRKYLVLGLISTEIIGILTLIGFLRVPLAQKFFTQPPEAYSVVSLSPQKRYLISQADLLTGKAIPNTTVKVLITPEFIKNTVKADSKGDWWYQIPPNLQTSIHRITFGNFDKSQKLVTFQTYKFRVESNISIFKLSNSLWKKINSIFGKTANAQVITGVDQNLYTSTGLPFPDAPITLTEDQRFRFINYFLPNAYSAAKIVNANNSKDNLEENRKLTYRMAMFTQKEDLITNYLDNCLDGNSNYGPDADYDPNTPCSGWGIPQWQVGWGHYPAQWANEKLAEAMAVMHPGKTIQQIGQKVIDDSYNLDMFATLTLNKKDLATYKNPITYPDRFPDDVTLEEIIEGSQPILNDGKDARDKPTDEEKSLVIGTNTCRPFTGANTNPRQDPKDCYMRQLLGILMKDPAVSAYLLASMWENLSAQEFIKEIQYQWGSSNESLQIASNILAGIDNEARGIDLESIAITPQITIPVAVAIQATQDPFYPIDGVQVEAIASQDGNALTEQELQQKNLKIERVIRAYGSVCEKNPEECERNPTSDYNVKGVTTIEEVYIDPEAAANPSDYQLCVQLKPIDIDFDVIIDEDCIPLDRIVGPQMPEDAPDQLNPTYQEPLISEPEPVSEPAFEEAVEETTQQTEELTPETEFTEYNFE